MTFEDINLLIISALYSKAMALFKTQAEQWQWAEQSRTGAQAGKLRLREEAQLTEETFSDDFDEFSLNWRWPRCMKFRYKTDMFDYELWVIMSNK